MSDKPKELKTNCCFQPEAKDDLTSPQQCGNYRHMVGTGRCRNTNMQSDEALCLFFKLSELRTLHTAPTGQVDGSLTQMKRGVPQTVSLVGVGTKAQQKLHCNTNKTF